MNSTEKSSGSVRAALLATYIVWVLFFLSVHPLLGYTAVSVVGFLFLLIWAIEYWRLLCIPIVLALLIGLFIFRKLNGKSPIGFERAFIANLAVIASLMLSAEAVSFFSMRLDAARQDISCYERQLLLVSLYAHDFTLWGRPFNPKPHAAGIMKDRVAVWSYKTMTFAEADTTAFWPRACKAQK